MESEKTEELNVIEVSENASIMESEKTEELNVIEVLENAPIMESEKTEELDVIEVSENALIMESEKTEELNFTEVSENAYIVEPLKNDEHITAVSENAYIVEPLKNDEQKVIEVPENLSIMESVKNEENVSENASMVEPVKNEEQNVTEISENTPIIESLKNEEQGVNKVLENAEFVKSEDQTEQVNETLQNLSNTNAVVPIRAIKLNEKFLNKSRYSVNLIDFDSDFETLPQQTSMFNAVNEHLMDSIDNYIEYESSLDKPLQPGKFVRRQENVPIDNITKKDFTGEHDNLFINNELNPKRSSLRFVITDDMDELRRKSLLYDQELMKDDFSMFVQQENDETRITQRPSIENAVNSKFSSKDYNNEIGKS